MDVRLDGRAAFITGGSQGLGRAMALKFAESGADVAIVARRPEVLEETRAEVQKVSGGKVVAYACDISSGEAAEEAFRAAERDLDGIDILVNNAGTSRAGPFMSISDEDWQGDLDLKLMAAIKLCRLAIPAMQSRQWGRIINVLNIGARAPRAASTPTSVSRAAGLALTKALAGEFGRDGILVNGLMTGFIATEQWPRLHAAKEPDTPYAEFVDRMVQARNIPLGRIGTAEEYANVACFLASDAGGYVNGTAINIDGGASPVP